MIIQDHNGDCMFAATLLNTYCIDATNAEAYTLRWALLKLKEMELDSVVIETYSKLVVSCFQQQREGTWFLSQLYKIAGFLLLIFIPLDCLMLIELGIRQLIY